MSVVWFVTGTDTDVGKTVATAAVVASLGAAGRSPYVVKPAQTGVEVDEPGDLAEIRRLVGDVPGHEGIRLRAPLAPDSAARLEGVALPSLATQRDRIVAAAQTHHVLVEGAGGVLVPTGDGWNLIDLATGVAGAGVDIGVLVVARAGLGTLNHTALTVQALRRAEVPVLGVVIGSWPAAPDLASESNLIDLPALSGAPLLGQIPEGVVSLTQAEFSSTAPGWIALPL